jgi:hypothetical protein
MTGLLVHIHQKEKITLEIARVNKPLVGKGWLPMVLTKIHL